MEERHYTRMVFSPQISILKEVLGIHFWLKLAQETWETMKIFIQFILHLILLGVTNWSQISKLRYVYQSTQDLLDFYSFMKFKSTKNSYVLLINFVCILGWRDLCWRRTRQRWTSSSSGIWEALSMVGWSPCCNFCLICWFSKKSPSWLSRFWKRG